MDLMSLQDRLVELRTQGRYLEARLLLDPLLGSPKRELRGMAHLHMAELLYRISFSQSKACLQHVESALQCIDSGSPTRLMAVLHGLIVALSIDRLEEARRYGAEAEESLAKFVPLQGWAGQILKLRGYLRQREAELAMEQGEGPKADRLLNQALRLQKQALHFFENHAGPGGEQEQARYRLESAVARAEVLLQRGDATEAVESMRPYLREGEPNPPCLLFWRGRVAALEGHWGEAVSLLNGVILQAREQGEYRLVHRAALHLAQIFARLGIVDELSRVVQPLLVEAATVENVGLVYQLQRLLQVGRRGAAPVHGAQSTSATLPDSTAAMRAIASSGT